MTTSTSPNAGLDNTGQRVIGGRYRLAGQIGRGAMGTVWRAKDELLDRDVAVKEVRLPESVSDAERANSYQRTLREARTAARLSHPGVAAVYDVVEELGRPWIVMELVPARSLDQVVAEDGPLPPYRAADMGRQVLAALTTAHAAGVLHRDVKPSNVLLAGDGRAVLTDFGIATVEGDPSLTQTGMVMGSPGFLAPERIRGDVATPASDLWSLGATLYAAVEGQGPYDRHGGVMTTMAAVVTEDPRPPIAAGPLTPVITALLSRDPAARPSAAAAAGMLDAIGAARRPAALPPAGAGAGGSDRPPAAPGGAVPAFDGAAPRGSRGAGQARGIQRHETLRPSAILPPGAPPPGPRAGPPPAPPPGPPPWAAHGVPGPAQPAAAAPARLAVPIRPPPGHGGALGPAPMGRGPGRGAPPRHKHRTGLVIVIGVAIFIVAAIIASQFHKAGSAGPTAPRRSAGAGQGRREVRVRVPAVRTAEDPRPRAVGRCPRVPAGIRSEREQRAAAPLDFRSRFRTAGGSGAAACAPSSKIPRAPGSSSLTSPRTPRPACWQSCPGCNARACCREPFPGTAAATSGWSGTRGPSPRTGRSAGTTSSPAGSTSSTGY